MKKYEEDEKDFQGGMNLAEIPGNMVYQLARLDHGSQDIGKKMLQQKRNVLPKMQRQSRLKKLFKN